MSGGSFAVLPDVAEYCEAHSSQEPEILRKLREETAAMPASQMQIGAAQGHFMAMLVRLLDVRHYLEIGVFTGYSSLAVALAMPENGKIIACDVSEEYTSVARRYWRDAGVEGNIDLRLAPALDTLVALNDQGLAGSFDMAFIDADKGNMWAYYEWCTELVRPGGLILADNVLWSGKVLSPEKEDADSRAIAEFNKKLATDSRSESLVLPLFDGLTVARVK